MGILSRLFARNTSSKLVAKERLRQVLMQDRAGIPPETLHLIKGEIIATISKHARVDLDGIEVNLAFTGGRTRLVANIPLAGVRGTREAEREALPQ